MILVVAVCFTCYYYVFHPNAADLTVSLPRIVPILTNPNVVKFLDQFVTYDAETHSVLIPLVSSMGYKIALCILMGICQALPLLHVMHDCSHTAWGNSQPMWYMGGRFFLDFYAGKFSIFYLFQIVLYGIMYLLPYGAFIHRL